MLYPPPAMLFVCLKTFLFCFVFCITWSKNRFVCEIYPLNCFKICTKFGITKMRNRAFNFFFKVITLLLTASVPIRLLDPTTNKSLKNIFFQQLFVMKIAIHAIQVRVARTRFVTNEMEQAHANVCLTMSAIRTVVVVHNVSQIAIVPVISLVSITNAKTLALASAVQVPNAMFPITPQYVPV